MSNPVSTVTFSYDPQELANVEAAISENRLSVYAAACFGDREHSLKLYEWNTSMSAAFYTPLQTAEIAFRNACHRELSAKFGSTWHDNPSFLGLDTTFAQSIDSAKERLLRFRKTIDTANVVSELSFGFWTKLLGRRYEQTLWIGCLRRAFPRFRIITGSRLSRRPVARRFDHLREFRNRIAHHELIFKRALLSDYISLLEAIAWMFSDVANWTDSISACRELLAAGPPKVPPVLKLPQKASV